MSDLGPVDCSVALAVATATAPRTGRSPEFTGRKYQAAGRNSAGPAALSTPVRVPGKLLFRRRCVAPLSPRSLVPQPHHVAPEHM